MKSHSHIGFWIVAFMVSVLLAPVFIKPTTMYERLDLEVKTIYEVFGTKIGGKVISTVNSVHGAVVSLGIQDAVKRAIHDKQDKENAVKNFSVVAEATVDPVNSYFQGLIMQLYGVLLRAVMVMSWFVLLLPFIVAVIVDGVSSRDAKVAELGYQNPTAFALSLHVVIVLCALPLLYIAAPLPITPTFTFWWVLVVALPMGYALSHVQPVLTR